MAKANLSADFLLTPFLLVPGVGGDPTLFPDWLGGLNAAAPLDARIDNAGSVLYHILLPANADTEIESGAGLDGFSYGSFPGLRNIAPNVPILDPNGLPLDFTRIRLIAARVRKINPGEDAGGTVTITTGDDMVPGNAFGLTDAEDIRLAAVADPAGWAPGATGKIDVKWTVTTAADTAHINLLVELVIIGDPLPPD